MNSEKGPNITVEVFLSLFKWFLVGDVIIILAVLAVFHSYINKSFNGTNYQISQEQSGMHNIQELNDVPKTNS